MIDIQAIPAVKSTVSTTTHLVTFADGVVVTIIGSNTIATRKAAYLKATANVPMPEIWTDIVLKDGTKLDFGTATDKNFRPSVKGTFNNIYITSKSLTNVKIDLTGITLIGSIIELGSGNNVEIIGATMIKTVRRPISFDFWLNNFKVNGFKFIDCGDYAIWASGANTSKEVNIGFKVVNCTFDNSGKIQMDGQFSTDGDIGLFKNIEIAYNTFKNNEGVGSVCYAGNAQDYDIHHNVVDNLNTVVNNHNGVFFMQGNGKFHDNKLTNYQGNAIRMWLYSRGSVAVNEIYNNVAYNTRKYGAFELQGFASHIVNGKTTFANAKVYNNTVGQMSTSKDWEGLILDVYGLNGGSFEMYDNLGFNLTTQRPPITDMINRQGDGKSTRVDGNVYKSNAIEAVQDTINFKSLITNKGAKL